MNIKFRPSIIVALFFLSICVSSQTKFEPVPANIKAVNQPDSPVQLTIDGIYPSKTNYRTFGYTLRNTGEKEVRAINIRTDRDGVLKSFSLGLPSIDDLGFEAGLKAGTSKTLSYPINGYDGKEGGTTLSVDFILFRDGSTWGPNLADNGDWLIGVFDGQGQFLTDVKKFVAAKDAEGLKGMIVRDGPPPDQIGMALENRTKRQVGFGTGYFVTRLAFRSDLLGRGDLLGVPARIRDVERSLNGAIAGDDGRRQFTVQYGFGAPIKFVTVTRGEQKIAFDERFSAGGDWLTGYGIRMKNESGKTIKAVSLGIFFPETLNSGLGMGSSLRYGPHPITQVENAKQPRIAPDQSFDIVINEENPHELMRFLATRQEQYKISRAVIELNYIDFEDGTRWSGGQFSKPDPENPKRWIPMKP